MTVAETLEGFQSRFNAAASAGLNKTIQLQVTGEESGVWVLKIINQTCELITGSIEKPDLTLTTSDKDWLAVATGQIDAMNAFLSGKIKATGDMMLAMKIPNLFTLK